MNPYYLPRDLLEKYETSLPRYTSYAQRRSASTVLSCAVWRRERTVCALNTS